MNTKIEFRVEGLDPDGEWHMLDRPLGIEGDHRAHCDRVVQVIRELNIARYSKVRLVKYVTTVEVIGEDITV